MKLFKTLSTVLLVAFVQTAVAADATIPYTEATKYIGQTKTVEGTVVGTYCNEKMCFLNFHADFKNNLSAVIMAADFAKFSKVTGKELKAEMDKMYMGKKVQITGMLNEYKGKNDEKARPQIALTDSANIKVLTK